MSAAPDVTSQRKPFYRVPMPIPPSPLIHAGPTIAPLSPTQENGNKYNGFSRLTASCFTVNYIMGTGFLTIPWAFVSSGLALGTAGMLLVTFFAYLGMVYMLECMARAEGVTSEVKRRGLSVPPPSPLISSRAPSPALDAWIDASRSRDGAPLVRNGRSRSSGALVDYGGVDDVPQVFEPCTSKREARMAWLRRKSTHLSPSPSLCEVGSRKFEVTELCLMFMGRESLISYIVLTALGLYGTLWAYASVFANALASFAPKYGYEAYLSIYAIIVVPMSLMEMKEQIAVQVSLSACRLLMVLAIVGSIAYALYCGNEHFDPTPDSADRALVKWSGLYVLLPVAAYASIFHQSIPGLSQPVADRSALSSIFGYVFFITSLSYCLVGNIVGYYFGDDVEVSANINWMGYHGGTGVLVPIEGGGYKRVDVAWWARLLSGYVVCFPALDVISAFPLNSITLGNNLLGYWFGEKVHEAEKSWRNRTYFRLCACIPPLLGALLMRDLGTITDFTGVTGFAFAFSYPALLFLYSKKMMEEHFPGLVVTRYSNSFSIEKWALLVFFFGTGLVVFVLGSLVWENWGGILVLYQRLMNKS